MHRAHLTIAATSVCLAVACIAALPDPVAAQDLVRITPLGGVEGEFCRMDRAMLFEDPNGTRILYDAGRTVAGPDDPRLGEIDIVLVSHVHGDHVGDRRMAAVDSGTCAEPDASVSTTPNSNSVEIAVAKGAVMVTGSEMASFFGARMKAAGGDPANSKLVRFGGMIDVGGVGITTVPAAHSNGLAPAFLDGPLREFMETAGITAYVGPPTGYVLQFSNGLTVWLSGDTGITAEQDLVVRQHYGAELAVINIGDVFTTGPEEAAWVVNEMVKPAAVIPSHANEVATDGGAIVAGTRTETFANAVTVPLHLPLSGRTMGFDGSGNCAEGC